MSTAVSVVSLEKILASSQLPALPQTAISLLQLSQQEDKGPSDFARPIEADPGLAGQVLKMVNSSYFGFSREISSIQQALTLVGVRSVTNFVLWNAVFSVVPNPQFGSFDLKTLWRDSLRRAVFARKLGQSLKLRDAEDLFAGALLQDMALPLLLKKLPAEYEALVRRRQETGDRLSQLEREAFGWDHAEAAGLMAKQWNLPDRFITLIEAHTQPQRWFDGKAEHLPSACVSLASLVPCDLDEGWMERDLFASGYQSVAGQAGEKLVELLDDTDRGTAEFAPLMKLTAPQKTLVQLWKA